MADQAFLTWLAIAWIAVCLLVAAICEAQEQRNGKRTLVKTLAAAATAHGLAVVKAAAVIIAGLIVGAVFIWPSLGRWIADNAATLNVLSTGVATVATSVYVLLTYYLLRTTLQGYRSQNRPNVHVYFDTYTVQTPVKSELGIYRSATYISLVIENQGNAPAYNIRFNPKSSRRQNSFFVLRSVYELSALNDGITYLAPHQSIRIGMGQIFTSSGEALDEAHIDILYHDSDKQTFFGSFVLSPAIFTRRA